MSDSEGKPSGELIVAGVELVKTAYGDALQPASKEVGKALGTLGKTINVALSPLRSLVWAWEKIETYLTETVERKLRERGVPPERVSTPDPDIAVPAIEALRYSKLRENFANLVATAMDISTSPEVHPAFVEILKQLSPDEARILEHLPPLGRYEPLMDLRFSLPEKGEFNVQTRVSTLGTDAKCQSPTAVPRLIDNLCRLGLTEIPPLRRLVDDHRYDRVRATEAYSQAKASIPQEALFVETPLMIGLTRLGESFRQACVTNPNSSPSTTPPP